MPLALFPADRQLPNFAAGFGVQVRLKEMELYRPRQWGAAGWLVIFMSNWHWMSSGRSVCATIARELAGSIFYKPWSAIVSVPVSVPNGTKIRAVYDGLERFLRRGPGTD